MDGHERHESQSVTDNAALAAAKQGEQASHPQRGGTFVKGPSSSGLSTMQSQKQSAQEEPTQVEQSLDEWEFVEEPEANNGVRPIKPGSAYGHLYFDITHKKWMKRIVSVEWYQPPDGVNNTSQEHKEAGEDKA